jgi:prophage DNA circulation protein
MPTNVIPGGEAFVFGPLQLHGNLQQLHATEEQDVAVHRVLKRDGAILEGMGWQANRYEATCVFAGPNFRADVVAMRNQIRLKSEDVIVHPLYGRFTARCNRITGALNIPVECNSTTITLSFIEAGIDPNQTATIAQTVASKSQSLTASAGNLVTLAAFYTSTAASGAVASLVSSANAYAAAASYAVQSGVPDPSLGTQVAIIETQAMAVIAAISSDPFAALDVDRFDALAAADLVYAATIDVQDALSRLRPQLVPYTVPAGCSYLSLLNTIYGTDALDREAEFAMFNPGIINPALIPAGTVVNLPAPPVQ